MTAPGRAAGTGGGDEWLAVAVIAAGLVTAAVWAGAQLASLVTRRETLPATPADALSALTRLPANVGDPAAAWPEPASELLPGPWAYWAATSITISTAVALAVAVFMLMTSSNVGTSRGQRLGVEPRARFARRRELAPIIVAGPTHGRFILGRVGRHLVATEDRSTQPTMSRRRRARHRVGDRSAVAVVGPTRCGKTATITAGALDWDSAAILSSVKPDLYLETIERRRRMGDVFVFDPFGELPDDLGTNVTRVGWSPLQAAASISGAQQAASTLLDATPNEGVTNANYWATKGMQLLWPILFAAAASDKTMGDVARWVALQDGDRGEGGEVYRQLGSLATKDGMVALEAQQALTSFVGFWKLDGRTRSDIFSTAQTMIAAWEDPYIAAASATAVMTSNGEITRPAMNLARLLRGNNTLYVIQPLGSAERFAVVFGGLLGDLLRDQAYEISRRTSQPIPPLLAVIDEAGNTPLRWLPQVASTCSGIGVQLVTVWQSLAQMRTIYQAQTDSLLTNHGSKVFFSGISDEATLRYVSDLCGEEEVPNHSTSADVHLSGGRRSMATSTTRTRLVPLDVLRQAPEGTALLLHGRLPPAHLVGRRPWEERRLRHLAEGHGPVPARPEIGPELSRALDTDVSVPEYVRAHLDEVASRQRQEVVATPTEPQAPAIPDDDVGDALDGGEEDDEPRLVDADRTRDPTPGDPDEPMPPTAEPRSGQEAEVVAMMNHLAHRPRARERPGIAR
jgi:type IV secretion system protein VirD4